MDDTTKVELTIKGEIAIIKVKPGCCYLVSVPKNTSELCARNIGLGVSQFLGCHPEHVGVMPADCKLSAITETDDDANEATDV